MATGLPTQKKRTRRAGSDSWQLPWIKAVRGTTDDCYDCPECGLDRPTGREISVNMKTSQGHQQCDSSVSNVALESRISESRHSRSHGFKQLESRQMPWQKRERLVILIYELHPKNALPLLQKTRLSTLLWREAKTKRICSSLVHTLHTLHVVHMVDVSRFCTPFRSHEGCQADSSRHVAEGLTIIIM